MADGARDDHLGRARPGGCDAGEFARKVRRLALDAGWVVDRLDCSLDEVLELHWTVSCLLPEAPGPPSNEMHRWLLATQRAIGVKLQTWSPRDLESLEA